MVVLEGGGMLTSGSNQYLQPDYLSPLPTTLDAKKSPLALLAQTCSQIGADSPGTKPLIPPLEKAKKSAESPVSPATKRSSPASGLAFKPYEANVLSKKSDSDSRPPSKVTVTSVNPAAAEDSSVDRKSVSSRAPSRKSASPPTSSAPTPDKSSPSSSSVSASTTTTATASSTERGKSASPSASPIIRSGLEILHGHPKDLPLGTYKAGALSSGLSGLSSSLCSGCPPGLEPTNPAFRPPFAGGPFSHHHAAAAAMLAQAGYPSSAATAAGAPGPYVSYARVKTAAGGEALVPVCKDPYCTGCQYSSAAHQQMLLCPSGCTQCDHHKYSLAALSAGLMPTPPLPYARPYVCNWIAGDAYCGKRFTTSDELLQHLRTHTSIAATAGSAAAAADSSAAAAAAAAAASMSLLGSPHSFLSASASALHRYPNPPLSPLSARYHPYSKPGMPGSLAASPFSAFNPAGLGPYYSPYTLYGQRIGAAVHP